jgi:hypothetical protein
MGCGPGNCAGCCANGQCLPPPLNSTVSFCGNGGNACQDCGRIGLECNAGYTCAPSGAGGGSGTGGGAPAGGGSEPGDPCQGVPIGGECLTSALLRFCSIPTGNGTPTVQTYQCAPATTCQSTGSGAACLASASSSCQAGDSRCTGPTTVQRCGNSGQWQAATTCAGRCVDSVVGGDCGPTMAMVSVTGTLLYQTRSPLPNLTDWGSPTAVPARNVFVASLRGNDWLHTTTTDAQGRFTLNVPTTPQSGDTVYFVAWGGDGLGVRYQVADPQFGPGTQTVGQSVTNPRVWSWSQPASAVTNGSSFTVTTAQGSGALNLFDQLQAIWAQSLRYNQGRQGLSLVMWLGLGTEWSCGACFSQSPMAGFDSQVWMPGGSQDEGYWSDYTTAHELGHWQMASYGQSPNEGGPHYLTCPTFPGQAWSEGYATWHAAATRNTSFLEDKQQGHFFWLDLNLRQYYPGSTGPVDLRPAAGISCGSSPACAGGQVDENLVAALLWDLSSSRASGMGEIFNAVASKHMNTSPWARRYTRRTWSVGSNCTKSSVIDTRQASLHFADTLDALRCGGNPSGSNALSAADLTAATVQGATTWYPYPAASPLCSSSLCYGCLSGSTCSAGNTNTACGTGGTRCVACGGGQTCTQGVCL